MRVKRTQRRACRIVLTARDDDLLRSLAAFRAARTSDLLLLAFPHVSRTAGAARLRKLFDGGYLAVDSEGLNSENVYSLDKLGRQYMKGRHGVTVEQRRGRALHHLALVHVWVHVLTATRDAGVPLHFVPDWKMRNKGHPLVPDAVFKVAGRTFALEIDLGTEPLGTLKRKFRLYREAIALEKLPEDTHLLLAHQHRGAALARLLETSWRSDESDLLSLPLAQPLTWLAAVLPCGNTATPEGEAACSTRACSSAISAPPRLSTIPTAATPSPR